MQLPKSSSSKISTATKYSAEAPAVHFYPKLYTPNGGGEDGNCPSTYKCHFSWKKSKFKENRIKIVGENISPNNTSHQFLWHNFQFSRGSMPSDLRSSALHNTFDVHESATKVHSGPILQLPTFPMHCFSIPLSLGWTITILDKLGLCMLRINLVYFSTHRQSLILNEAIPESYPIQIVTTEICDWLANNFLVNSLDRLL